MTAPVWVPSPANAHNYGSRRGVRIDTLIFHTTEGSWESAVAWFKDPDAAASAHYVVSPDGLIAQCVTDDYAAWHAGNGQFNRRSIGIECAGHAADPATWTDALVAATLDLAMYLIVLHGIPRDRQHLMGHAEVPDPKDPTRTGGANHHTDPGPYFPWGRLMAEITGQVATAAVLPATLPPTGGTT